VKFYVYKMIVDNGGTPCVTANPTDLCYNNAVWVIHSQFDFQRSC